MARARQMNLLLGLERWLWRNQDWRRSENPAEARVSFEDVAAFAEKAERWKFDGLFFADFMGLNRAVVPRNPPFAFEPLTVMAGLGARTKHLGLVCTASTLLMEPYNLARMFSSLDQVSNGRAGWNIVTSFSGERNFGKTLPAPAERYDAAQEFVEVVESLWDSWSEDYAIADVEGAVFVDETRIHDIDHSGRFFQVEGALDLPRMPQRYPVMFQAVASPEGLRFAARNAEAVFVSYPTLDIGAEMSASFRRLVAEQGRDGDDVRILPGLKVVIGEDEADARRKLRERYVTPERIALTIAGIEQEYPMLNLHDLDRSLPVPESTFPSEAEINELGGRRSRMLAWRRLALDTFDNAGDFLDHIAVAYAHTLFVGTPETIADQMEEWFRRRVCDGFIINESWDLDEIGEKLLPVLRRRGLFREDYEADTFRGLLGLPDPA